MEIDTVAKPLATTRRLAAFALGLAGALVAVALYWAGLDRRAELYALDVRFQHASSARPPENLLHVDIDDRSLAEVGRWPWPRQTLADVVAILNECGARTIALDIIMPEPQAVRYVSEAHTVRGADESKLISDANPVPVWDDLILMQTIRDCGNVMLPMHVDFATSEIGGPDPRNPLRIHVRALLRDSPRASFREVLAEVLPDIPAHATTPDRDIVEAAYLRQRALAEMERFAQGVGRGPEESIDEALLTPPLASLGRASHGSGFVTFIPDSDKAMRRIPLLARNYWLLYPQFALAVAADELARDHGGEWHFEAETDAVTLHFADGTWRSIPVDADGRMLIHWAQGTWPPNANDANRLRISAASVALIAQERHRLTRLKAQAQSLRMALMKMGVKAPNPRLDEMFMECGRLVDAADEAYLALRDARRQTLSAALYGPEKDLDLARLEQLAQAERQSEGRLVKTTGEFIAGIRKDGNLDVFLGKPADSGPADGIAKFRAAKSAATTLLDSLDSLQAEAARTAANATRLRDELAAIVKDKICLVGSTSTGAADFVPSPLHARTPGVVVHSNIIDTILTGRFIHEAHWSVNVLAILALGAAASAIAAWRPVVQAAAAVIVLGGAYVAFNGWVVFGLWSVWLTAVAPLVAVLASFLVVTAYRQLTEERGRRQLKAMLVQTLSPEVVEEVLKDPSLLNPGGQRSPLTCLFSDLAGFTPLSEALGPRETVRLLNRYFDGATDAIAARHGGWVNKFLGDGIFAIFGVPVRPERHAARAVEAALDCQHAVDQLNAQLSGERGTAVELSVRIGITTGEAMVGNCGSTAKADLTAIGNYVNQASRLEAANKSFGTRIIVAEETWASCDRQALLARPLGRVFIVGVSEAVRVWHVMGRVEALGKDLAPALEDFARAMDLFIAEDFTGALALLDKTAPALGNDAATRYYADLCAQCAARPAGDETWRPVHHTKGVARIALPWQDVNPNEHTK